MIFAVNTCSSSDGKVCIKLDWESWSTTVSGCDHVVMVSSSLIPNTLLNVKLNVVAWLSCGTGATPLASSPPGHTKPEDHAEVVTPPQRSGSRKPEDTMTTPPRSGSQGSRGSPRSRGRRSSPRSTPKENVHPMARGDASTPRSMCNWGSSLE